MPELPEVETTLRGIEKHILHQTITHVIIRDYRLRWPIAKNIPEILKGNTIQHLSRRGKYLLLSMTKGCLILHLGMSGSLRIVTQKTLIKKHDHIDIEFQNHKILRFNDPRRFGAFIFTEDDPYKHPLLVDLGPEPLDDNFSGEFLWEKARRRNIAIKTFIMNNKIIVGVGNIYATEALFEASIHPKKIAKRVTQLEFENLVKHIKKILRAAIKQGGTTLRNFVDSNGNPGYFKLHLSAYGRAGLPCVRCNNILKEIRLGQRSTVYCSRCQKK